MDELNDAGMIGGGVYRVRFRSQGGNYRWYERELIGTFLGRQGHTLMFSLRPEAGTTDIHDHDIIEVELLPRGTKARRPRKVA